MVSLLVSMFAFRGGVFVSVFAEPAWFSYPQTITSVGIDVVGSHGSLWPADTLHIGVTYAPPYPVWANVVAYASYDQNNWVSLGSIGIFNNPSMENANPTFAASMLATSLGISSSDWGTSIGNLYFVLVDVTDSDRSTELQQSLHPGTVSTYVVSFEDSGLPTGTEWSVTFNSQTQSSTSNSITFSAPAGSYSFSTSASGYIASPTSQGTINVAGDLNVPMNWFLSGAEEVYLQISEYGLPSSADWSVTFGSITQTTNPSNHIEFDFPKSQATYTFSATSTGYTAKPSPFDVNMMTPKPSAGSSTQATPIETYVIFVPNSNPSYFTSWNPVKESYSTSNLESAWSSNGYCYGLASTALLYFMHKSDATYPCLPLQQPSEPDSTSGLDLGGFGLGDSTLNNAALAIVFHQKYDTNNGWVLPGDMNACFEDLSSSLQKGTPEVLRAWMQSNHADAHDVVAWGTGELQDGTYAIALYDPNYPESTQVAVYNPTSKSFLYQAGPYDAFMTISPAKIKAYLNSPLDLLSSFAGKWQGSITGYTIVIADKNVKVVNPPFNYLTSGSIPVNTIKDYFTGWGNSQSFVCGIPGSSGIEEGNAQVYAVPSYTPISVLDPYSDQSAIFIAGADNESGALVGYGCLLNATTMQGSLNYTLTLSRSGLSISTGDNALNASITFFLATDQGYSISDVMTAQVDVSQGVSLAAPCLASFTASKNVVGKGYAISVNVTIANVGNNPENASITLYADGTILDSETVLNLSNRTSINLLCGGNTSSCDYGNYTLSAYCEPNGINEAANNFTCTGSVTVTIPGDVNGNFIVNILDAILLSNAYNSQPFGPNWKANADINGDNIINILDAIILSNHYNQHYP